MYLSAFLDFANILLDIGQNKAHKNYYCNYNYGFDYGFFPIKKLFLRDENLSKYRRCLLKTYNPAHF